MKNITRFFIPIFSCILFFASCVKESDVTTTGDPVISEPIDGEVYRISGTVFDTTGNALPFVELKAYFDSLEIEASADSEGNYQYQIPISKTEGYIVANQERFSKGILSVKNIANSSQKDIYLAEIPTNSSLDLSLATDSLITIRGRVIDEVGSPVEKARIAGRAVNNGSTISFAFLGYTETDSDGNFELIAENGDYFSKTIYAYFPSQCNVQNAVSWSDDSSEKELGDIEIQLNLADSKSISTNLKLADCSNEHANRILYFADFPILNIYDHPTEEVMIEYCDGTFNSEYVFAGVYSDDRRDFNGQFVKSDELSAEFPLDFCTPDTYFLEVTVGGNTTVFDDAFYKSAEAAVVVERTDGSYFFGRGNSTKFFDTNNDLVFKTGEISFTISLNSDDSLRFIKDANHKIYIHYFDDTDTELAGIITGKVKTGDGSIQDLQARFRVEKR